MLNRRDFLAASTPLLFAPGRFDLYAIERPRVIKSANEYLKQKPITITSSHSDRSAGGPHDYFSEADYWWPDPKDPNAPYIQRDGMSNPDNFVTHRHALIRLSLQVPALCAAWMLTGRRDYAEKAADHLRAWFIDKSTFMNPNLQYAQAIHGRTTGRGTGIIDTLQLVDVVRGAGAIESSGVLTGAELQTLRQWFTEYLTWMTTSKNGIEERDAKNNHGTCWVLQVAVFAAFAANVELMNDCRRRLKALLIPDQMAPNGSFPLELHRTKPYGYSLFNLEVMAGICQILSTSSDNLWTFRLPDGRGMGKAEAFLYPYIKDKKQWPYPPDVMYFDDWPVREQSLLFAGLALEKPEYLDLWRSLDPDPTTEEIVRNYPIRQPLLWMNKAIPAAAAAIPA